MTDVCLQLERSRYCKGSRGIFVVSYDCSVIPCDYLQGGYFTKFLLVGIKKKWTKSDLKFYKNEGCLRSKTNEKGGQLDKNFRQKLM